MKSYEYYKMIAKSEDITLLFKIFKHLEPDWLCKRNRNTLYFGDMKHKYRGMMFKLARYVRNKSIRVILENILLLLEEGFPIWEAIPLGHHSVASIPSYYNSSIDLIMVNWTYDSRKVLMYSNNSPVRYKTLSLFKTKCIRANYWNHIFASPHSTLTIATFRKLFNDKNYDELKKILENQ
ncbi:hypothetical protein Phi14:2_gp037 [Cellulophaga phage phi14:2]|uniref:Uncharacterized protein n=2 Tax=Cellulophaga phage phi14:2 TaxID=1327990 RepID=S0A285_9CAUD|nr:hypothetical protein Phi14:2_gp037 [Cellulophaga phage phi14:2]